MTAAGKSLLFNIRDMKTDNKTNQKLILEIEELKKQNTELQKKLRNKRTESKFDEQYLFYVLKRTISEMARVLKPGGMLIIIDNIYPDHRRPLRKTVFGNIFHNNGNPNKLRFFPDNTLQGLMESNLKFLKNEMLGHSFFEMYVSR